MASLSTSGRPVRPLNYLAYGLNDFLGAGSMAIISGWVLFFYTTFAGLTAVQAATIFGVARLIDAVVSPLVGHISDNLGHTWLGRNLGRRRGLILLALPFLPSFALMWVDGQGFWYYLATYVLFEVVYTTILIPYETLAAEMSDDYRTKAKFAGVRILCGQTAAILAGFLPGRIIEHLGKDSAATFLYLGAMSAVIFIAVGLGVFFFTWERPRSAAQVEAERPVRRTPLAALKGLYASLGSTLRVRAFRLHLGMYLGGYISQDVFNAVFTYFVVFAIGGTVLGASNLLGTMYVAQLVSVFLAIQLVIRIGPASTYRTAVLLYAAALAAFLVLHAVRPQPVSLWLFAPVVLAGLGRGALNYIPWNTYNYMADVDEIVTGQRREGAYAGVMTFIRKATQAAAVAIVGVLLEAGGFAPGQKETQSPEAVRTILTIMTGGTLTVLALGFLVSLRFRLNGETHAVLMGEILRFRAGERTPSSEAARAVVEDLSGWKYERLWGANGVATTLPDQPAAASGAELEGAGPRG